MTLLEHGTINYRKTSPRRRGDDPLSGHVYGLDYDFSPQARG